MDQWKGITLSYEHADSKWITETDMKHFEFHGTNQAIVTEAFQYINKGRETIY
jgi:hypothetical protein